MPEPHKHASLDTEGLSRSSDFVMSVENMRRIVQTVVAVTIPLAIMSVCQSRQLSEEGIETCLVRTDFTGHDAGLREAIGWHIEYDRKVRDTTCCALQPRADVLSKRNDLGSFKKELLGRIDLLETQGPLQHEYRSDLRKNNPCYGALMDLYHDLNLAADHPRRR